MKLKISLIAFVAIFIIASCSETSNNVLKIDTLFPKVVFDSQADFFAFTDNIQKMSDAELDAWEKQKGFISYRTIFKAAKLNYSLLENDIDREKFLKENDDILFLSDSVITPRINTRLYQSITNREGVYETTGFINKLIGDYVVSVEKGEYYRIKDLKENDINNGQKISEVDIYNYAGADVELSTSGRINTSCSTYNTASYFYNASSCKNDREAFISVKSFNLYINSSDGPRYQLRVELHVWAKLRKGISCKWDFYATRRSSSFFCGYCTGFHDSALRRQKSRCW